MRPSIPLTLRRLTLLACLLFCRALAADDSTPAYAGSLVQRGAYPGGSNGDPVAGFTRGLSVGAFGAPSFLRAGSPLLAAMPGGTPYTGTALPVPGTIQAEDFDNGGEGVAYHDTSTANEGGFYRSTGVDVTSTYAGPNVGWTQVGEWLEYTVSVAATSTYKFEVFAATPMSTGNVHIEIDGVNVTGNMPIPNTGGWGNYGASSKSGVLLTAGTHVMRVSIDGYGFLFDRVQITTEQTPYGGTAWPVPGTIQAEDFDNGGEGVAYHDTTTANEGGFYRTTGVDVTSTYAGPNIGWTQTGEWMKYTVNVASTGSYTFEAYAASPQATGALRMAVDGVDVTGLMPVPNTGSWSTYAAVTKTGVNLTAGQHVLKVSVEGYGFLFDRIRIVPAAPAAPSGLTAAAASTTQVNLSWADSSSNETGFKVERKTGAGGTYSEVATVGAGVTSYSNTGLASNTQYFYRVRATNLGGDSAYSNEAGATTLNTPPSVSITSPESGTSYTAPAAVMLTASASDPDGAVTKVEFFSGTSPLGTVTAAPYTLTVSNAPAGNYTVTARATDSNGAQTTSAAINVTVSLPTVTITATDASASEQGPDAGAFTVTRAGATGLTNSPLTVNFTAGGTATGGADYAAVGTSVTIPAGAISHTVTVTPMDDAVVEQGGETVVLTLAANSAYTVGTPASAVVQIADNDTTPPTVSLTAPAAAASFTAPATINMTANASDPDPGGSVAKVEFFQGSTKLGEDTSAPFAFSWADAPAGSYSLTAKATDNAGAAGTSAPVAVTVNAPPSVSVTSPAADAVFDAGSDVTVSASASDADGTVTKVAFYCGAVLIGEDTTAPYSVTWTNATLGGHVLTARATDNSGAVTASGGVYVLINQAPSVTLTAPSNGDSFTAPANVQITAGASDADGSVTKVQFFQGDTLLGEDASAPFAFTWGSVPAGSYSLKAVATDDHGATTASVAVGIVVNVPNTPPAVSITSPADGSSIYSPNVTVISSASDADGSVGKVEFFDGTTKLGEDTSAPFAFTWYGAAEGGHTLTAVATDDRGAQTTSAPATVSIIDFAAARLDPANRTGGGGVDLVSRNFNWSLPLVNLPGRAGLDLALSLSYNSLVWTKSGNYVLFDGDGGWPAPGFRLGFPVVQGMFYDAAAQKPAYMLITPSGARVSLRQAVADPKVYEAGDSSYMQLTEETDGSLTLRTTAGTQMTFRVQGSVYQCEKVTDSNGNFITVTYNASGNVEEVIDTLGRVVSFVYSPTDGRLEKITQAWSREVEGGAPSAETYEWARFDYETRTLGITFAGPTPLGAQHGQTFRALTKVTLADGSGYVFDYTTWGQVYRFTNFAQDGHRLHRVTLDLPSDASQPQSDCPRFVNRRVWAAYWNGDADGVPAESEEAVTWFDDYNFAGGIGKAKAPDGTLHKETYDTAGWRKGLVTRTDTYSADDYNNPKKWTLLDWTQDDESLGYVLNPRVRETNVHDAEGRHGRTKVTYTSFGLPADVEEYDEDATAVVRRTHTEYVPGSVSVNGTYVGRRIIGLPRERTVYGAEGGQEKLFSKVSYEYDQTGEFLVNAGQVGHHEGSYGDTFTLRGNVSRTRRWDVSTENGVSNENNVLKSVSYETGYNTLGSVIFTRDASGHRVNISYADSDGGGRLAYPTTVTDPDGFTSSTWYNYDMGVVTRVETPKPNVTGDLPGPATARYYDTAGRPLKVKQEADNSYTKWEYGAGGLYVKESTAMDAGQAETFVLSVTDGAGRVIGVLRENPGLGTGYAATRTEYDRMGRPVKSFNPAEVSINAGDLSDERSWVPAGEDAKPDGRDGWVFAATVYDWKGRPQKVTHSADGSAFEYKYDGCGCAGSDVVTTRDEVGRRRRLTYDVLGRIRKTEVLTQQNASDPFTVAPNETPYSTTTTTYDALDRVTEVREHAEETGVEQVTTTEYDGHGRLRRRHLPQYDANKFTTYAYNDDDTLASVTDPRGAVAAYDYEGNERHLVKQLTHTLPGSDPISVSFQYDAAGNCTQMDDGPGWVTYEYDMSSRLLEEKRHFDALGTNPHNPYKLNYTYTASGQLKTLTDPFGSQFTYGFDRAGQLRTVTGSPYAGVTNYAKDVEYRAWGGVKSASFGDGAAQTTQYDSRMRPWQYRMTGGAAALREDFTYYADGRLRQVTDLDDGTYDPSPQYRTMSRLYRYDHVGRVTEAGGNTGGVNSPSPYRQFYSYDAFDNLTTRSGAYGYRMAQTDTASYSNQRRDGWTYDAAGQLTLSPANDASATRSWQYDAAGRLVVTTETPSGGGAASALTQTYDGDGQVVHESKTGGAATFYVVRSTVLGGEVVTRLDASGGKQYTYVPAGGLVHARQTVDQSSGSPAMEWAHRDPAGVTEKGTAGLAAYDPLGNYAPLPPGPPQSGQWPQPGGYYGPIWGGAGSLFSNVNNFSTGCLLDGRPADCNRVTQLRNNKAVGLDPNTTRPYTHSGYDNPLPLWPGGIAHFDSNAENVPGENYYLGGDGSTAGPQGDPFGDAYRNCLGALGNNPNAPAPGQDQARAIIKVANDIGVDPTLLAATWRFEGGFDLNSGFLWNPKNGTHNPARTRADIGPGQVNPEIWNKEPFTNGLSNPFGTNRKVGEIFNGSGMDNLKLTARALNAASGPRDHKAGIFRAGRQFDVDRNKAGKVIKKTENRSYRLRADEFNSVAPNYDSFFECLAKQGFFY